MNASAVAPSAATDEIAPIALEPGEGESLWFLGAHVSVKASSETTAGRVDVIEHLAPRGAGSPLHVHTREDEWFYVIEGALTFWVGGQVIDAPAGSFVYGPRGIAHTFLVSSERARFLLVTEQQITRGGLTSAARYVFSPLLNDQKVESQNLAVSFDRENSAHQYE